MKPAAENNVKICIVSISLAKGGLERAVALLTQMLNREGFEVHLVLLNDKIDYEYEAELFNLGKLKSQKDTIFNRLKRFKKLRQYLEKNDFEYIIDTRTKKSALKELYYLKYIYRKCKLIYLVSSYKLDAYFPKVKWVADQMVNRAEKIVCVSNLIETKIMSLYGTNKTITIYNPIHALQGIESTFQKSEKYIIFLGRLEDEVKNISLLLESYKISSLSTNGVHLKILGDGADQRLIEDKIKALNLLSNVEMIPFTTEIYPYLSNAYFLTLTSRHEGFPMALLEALSVGIPVISVDCNSGPSEIIQHEENGLLVQNYDSKALSEAFNRFLFDTELYNRCKSNSKQSVSHLNPKDIAKQWSKILNK